MISSWLQGHTWPNGDPDKLRSLGTAWRAAAKGLRGASDSTSQAWTNVEENASEELPQAIDQMDAVWMGVGTVATQYEKLGSACEDWAQQIEDAHHKILAILAGAIGAGLIAGVVVGFFTAGTGTVATTAAAGSAAGAAVVTVLVAFDAAAAVAAGVTVAAGVAAVVVATELQPLLEANPTQFMPARAQVAVAVAAAIRARLKFRVIGCLVLPTTGKGWLGRSRDRQGTVTRSGLCSLTRSIRMDMSDSTIRTANRSISQANRVPRAPHISR